MKREIRLFIKFSFVLFILSGCNMKRGKEELQVYITPKNPNYGWADNGVFRYDFNSKSVYVNFDDRSYNSIILQDSMCELYFNSLKINKKEKGYLFKKANAKIGKPRMLLILNTYDTIFVDRNLNYLSKLDDRNFGKLNFKALDRYVKLPEELKDNWLFERNPR